MAETPRLIVGDSVFTRDGDRWVRGVGAWATVVGRDLGAVLDALAATEGRAGGFVSGEIANALTPEEWAKLEHSTHEQAHGGSCAGVENGEFYAFAFDEDSGTAGFRGADLAAVVALANAARSDGDPGKITRADVRRLLDVDTTSEEDWRAVERIAAKLAALLPPTSAAPGGNDATDGAATTGDPLMDRHLVNPEGTGGREE